jgi:hypothetical protein
MLHVVFALDRRLNVFVVFEVNKALDGIPFSESRDEPVSMFVNSSNKVGGNANVQNAVGRTCQNINVAPNIRE